MSKRRKKFNPVNAASLARWIVIFVFAAVTGLSYVYLSIQLHSVANQREKLEHDSADLRNQISNARVQIAAFTSYTALQRRLQEGYLKMIPITNQKIVQLNPPTRPLEDDSVRPIANERGER